MNYRIFLLFLTVITPLFAQYSFEFVCTSDTFQTGTDYFVYYFRLTNTGSQPDTYAFDCRVVDSVPGWFEIYCAGGQCAEPGIILYDYLTPGAVDTGIDISIYTAAGIWGTETVNLLVWSLHNPNLRDSINVYAAMEQAVDEKKTEELFNKVNLYPNPFTNHCVIKFQVSNGNIGQGLILAIYDVSGRVVKSFNHLADSPFSQIIWYGDDDNHRKVPEGVYFIELHNGKDKIQRKVIKIR